MSRSRSQGTFCILSSRALRPCILFLTILALLCGGIDPGWAATKKSTSTSKKQTTTKRGAKSKTAVTKSQTKKPATDSAASTKSRNPGEEEETETARTDTEDKITT